MAIATGTAIMGAAALSAGASIFGASQADKRAGQAESRQLALDEADLAFQMERYQDWQDIYGPIQENLSSFYQGLTPETFAASGLQQYEQEFQETDRQLQRSFAQRGIDSPAQEAITTGAALTRAEKRADIRHQAPLKVAEAKQSFLDKDVVNPLGRDVSQARRGQSAFFGGQAERLRREAGTSYAAAGRAITSGVEGYVKAQQLETLQDKPVTPYYGRA